MGRRANDCGHFLAGTPSNVQSARAENKTRPPNDSRNARVSRQVSCAKIPGRRDATGCSGFRPYAGRDNPIKVT